MRDRSNLLVALFLGLFVFGIRAPLMELPLERDEGEYAYIAWRMQEGEVPYRDWFNQKPPGVFLAYRVALALPFDAVWSIRAVAAVAVALAAIALFALLLGPIGRGGAVLGALLFSALASDPWVQGPIANTELFMLAPIIAATHATLKLGPLPSDGRAFAVRAVAVGALLAVATMFKQVAAIHVALLVTIVSILPDAAASQGADTRPWRVVRFCGWAFGGFVLVWGPLLAVFALHGALSETVDAILWHNLEYVGGTPLDRRIANFQRTFAAMGPSQAPALCVALLGLPLIASKLGRFPAVLFGGWMLTAAVGVSAGGHFFPHYFQQLLPAVAGAAACAVVALQPVSGWRAVVVAGLAGLVVIPPLAAAATFSTLPSDEATRRLYPGNPFEAMPEIAREIAMLSEPDDTVFVFGTEPELLFYAERVSATRYIHLFPLFGPYASAPDRQQEVIRDLEKARPAVIVWLGNRMFRRPVGRGGLIDFAHRTLERDYRLHAEIVRVGEERGVVVPVGRSRQATLPPDLRGFGGLYVRDDLDRSPRATRTGAGGTR